MEYRTLGRSGLKVSPLCLGTMMFGGETNEADALAIVARARAQGVNFIDTANVYNQGRSEEVVGRAIAKERDWWVLATKIASTSGAGPNGRGTSRLHVFRAVEACLKRLAVETIDILYLHRDDRDTPMEETVRAVADLMRAGKLRYFGLSNFRAWRVAEMCRLSDAAGGRNVGMEGFWDLDRAMRQISDEIRSEYVLAFRPENLTHDGKFRRVSLRVKIECGSQR